MKSFKFSENIKEAWFLYKKNIAMFFLIMACFLFLEVVGMKSGPLLWAIIFIVWIFLLYMVGSFLLSMIDKKEFNPFSKKSIPGIERFWRFIKTTIVFYVISFGIFYLAMVPLYFVSPRFMFFNHAYQYVMIALITISILAEIYFSARLLFSCFISIDHNYGARKSIKKSWRITGKNFWSILWKVIIIGIISTAGFVLAPVWGMIFRSFSFILSMALIVSSVAVPLGMILMALLYRNLQKAKDDEPVIVSAEKDEKKENEEGVIKEAEIIKE